MYNRTYGPKMRSPYRCTKPVGALIRTKRRSHANRKGDYTLIILCAGCWLQEFSEVRVPVEIPVTHAVIHGASLTRLISFVNRGPGRPFKHHL